MHKCTTTDLIPDSQFNACMHACLYMLLYIAFQCRGLQISRSKQTNTVKYFCPDVCTYRHTIELNTTFSIEFTAVLTSQCTNSNMRARINYVIINIPYRFNPRIPARLEQTKQNLSIECSAISHSE